MRWDLGLVRIRSFRVVVVVVVVVVVTGILKNHKKCKTEIDDESYLEKRLGINSDGKSHGVPLRIFFKKTEAIILSENVTLPRKKLPVLGHKYKN